MSLPSFFFILPFCFRRTTLKKKDLEKHALVTDLGSRAGLFFFFFKCLVCLVGFLISVSALRIYLAWISSEKKKHDDMKEDMDCSDQ